MGRTKMKDTKGFITCKVCERAFKLINEDHIKIFSNVNEELDDAIDDAMSVMTKEEWNKLLDEPFYKHLNDDRHCPNAHCKVCDENNKSYNLFTTRQQHYSHNRKYHSCKNQMTGRTGFTARIRKDVATMCERHLIKISKYQREGNKLKYPKIELSITDYEDGSMDEIMEQSFIDKQEKKEKQVEALKKKRMKKKNDKIMADLARQIELHEIETGKPISDLV